MFTAEDIVLKCSLGSEVYFTYLLVSFSLVSLQNYSIKILHLPATKVFFLNISIKVLHLKSFSFFVVVVVVVVVIVNILLSLRNTRSQLS